MDAASALTRLARSGVVAAATFFALAIFMTWPLAAALTRNIPGDYGDPLYAAWALAWVSHQLGRALTGHFDALTHFWDANQLFPEQHALAFSDHFIAQALPVAPLYWMTGNPILSLNAAYLIAFTLSGLGTFLLVRELTGSAAAGLASGVVLAFNEFVLYSELSHLQVLSTGWMPLALYALRRYFVGRSRVALAAAGCCLVLSNLSAGYYLVMFAPFVALYCVWEITTRRAWRDHRLLVDLALLAAGVLVVTLPFIWPYLEMRRRFGFSRSLGEVQSMAAPVDAYLASFQRMAVAYVLAAIAIAASAVRAVTRAGTAAGTGGQLAGFWIVAGLIAFWLSLGPLPALYGSTYPAVSLYTALAPYWPGLDAIRVPARFVSIFLVFFAVLVGLGGGLLARMGKAGVVATLVLGAAIVGMNVRRPFPLNRELLSPYVKPTAAYLRPSPEPPPVYRYISSLPPNAALAEFPADDLWYSTRYLYFSTFHWRPIVNGFTSFYPPAALDRIRWLINPLRTPDEAWTTLRSAGVTHVVLHTGAWDENTARSLMAYFEGRGARMHVQFDGAIVYELPQK